MSKNRRKPEHRTGPQKGSYDRLMAEFEAGAAGAPIGPGVAAWRTVAFIEQDVQEFEPYPQEEEPTVTDLGELQHTPVRDSPPSVIGELSEAPIIDAVIVDDDDAST